MASNRAFKNLASLKTHFDEPFDDENSSSPASADHKLDATLYGQAQPQHTLHSPVLVRGHEREQQHVSPVTGKVDGRRLRKVLKTPSVSLSVAVRTELHEEVSSMLFARKSTWIALLDELLTDYVNKAKDMGQFPK